MIEKALPGLLTGLFVAALLLGLIFYAMKRAEKKRSVALQLAAESRGFDFEFVVDEDIFNKYTHFTILSTGMSRKLLNRIWGAVDGATFNFFEHRYSKGQQGGSSTHTKSVVAFDLNGLIMPEHRRYD